MTLSSLLLKAVAGATLVAGSTTGASFAIYQSVTQANIGPTTNPVVLVQATTTLASASQLTVNTPTTTNENYKCQLAGDTSTLDFCRLVKLDLSKGWIDVNGIKKAKASDTVSLTDLKADANHFKLEVNPALYSRVDLRTKKHIEIISTTTKNKILPKLNVSFKVSGGFSYTSTNYWLGKALSPSGTHGSSKDYQCPSTTSRTHACSIYPFGSTPAILTGPGYHKQTQLNLLKTPATGQLIKDQYYILHYTPPATHNPHNINPIPRSPSLSNLVPVIIQGKHNKKAFILSDTPSYSIIVKKSTTLETNKAITHTTTDKNYKCQFDTATPIPCELVVLPLSQSKTSIDIAGIKNEHLTTPLAIQHSDTTVKFFKLDVLVPVSNISKYKSSASATKIQIVDATTPSTKIGDVTPLFAIDDDNVPYFQKSTFLVKTAVISGDGAFDASKTHYCSFSTTDNPAVNPQKCKLIDLGSSEISSSQEITDTEAASPITTEKNYLVKFIDGSNNTTVVAQNTKGANNMLFLQEDVGTSSKKLVAKFANQHIQPALVVDADSSKKFLFILA